MRLYADAECRFKLSPKQSTNDSLGYSVKLLQVTALVSTTVCIQETKDVICRETLSVTHEKQLLKFVHMIQQYKQLHLYSTLQYIQVSFNCVVSA